MRKFGGFILILLGLVSLFAFFYLGYGGKYGLNTVMNSFPDRLDTDAAVFGVGALALLIWGCVFLFKKKR